jgi:hypothetical protein
MLLDGPDFQAWCMSQLLSLVALWLGVFSGNVRAGSCVNLI